MSKKMNKLPPFVAMDWKVLNSDAYKSLSHSSRASLPYWLGKPKKPFNDAENYEIDFKFPYAEAANYGFARATFARIIQEVISNGFVDPIRKGGLRGDGKSCSRFVLSRRWQNYGKPDFKKILWRQFVSR